MASCSQDCGACAIARYDPAASLREIGDVRPRAEVLEQLAAAGRLGEARDLAFRVLEIAEHERPRRARLRARRLDLAVAQRALLGPGLDLRALDPLHAERALLHHADLAQRNVRVELQLERLVPRWVEEVEEADVVRAGVGAVARADAAVVHLRVEPVRGVMARVGGTHRLARRVVALLAHHGAELEPHVREVAFPVPLHTNPVLGPADGGLLRADRRDVVLGVTRRDARPAPRAAIEIDRHSPSRPSFVSLLGLRSPGHLPIRSASRRHTSALARDPAEAQPADRRP